MAYTEQDHRDNMRSRQAAKRSEERNIVIPGIVNVARRKRCKKSLAKFLTTYFPEMFNKPWSAAHKECIDKMEYAIIHGGQFADALPRGEGKTTLAKGASLWAVVNCYRRYVMLIGATEPKAEGLLKDIKSMVRFSDLLLEDYPELCACVRAIENVSTRTRAQTAQLSDELASQFEKLYKVKDLTGKRLHTEMTWVTKKFVFPTIEGSLYSGAVIEIAGITGDIRGRTHGCTDGTVIRPDIAIIDDPQTNDSARSPSQCQVREDIIKADVLGLAGPGEKITCFMPCTVIKADDLAARFLDIERNPDWQGIRSQMITSWPENIELWEEYNKVRIRGLKKQDNGKMANGFYKKNREKMDYGGTVSWKERKAKGDISALQHAMDLFFKLGEKAFYSEYQNDPQPEYQSVFELSEDVVQSRAIGTDYRDIPEVCQFLTCMGDVNQYGIHYTVLATTTDFAGWVVDYGKFPKGERNWIWKEDDNHGLTLAQAIYKAVVDFCTEINSRDYLKNGQRQMIDLMTIDCGWMMNEVFRAVNYANSQLPIEVVTSRGWAHKDYRTTKAIGRLGDNCHRGVFDGKGRVLNHNSDYWRQRTQQAFLCMPGSPASLALYGKPSNHETFASHICAEILAEHVQGEKYEYYTWHKKPGMRNDLLDAMVGSMAAANIIGASFDGAGIASYKVKQSEQKEQNTEIQDKKPEPEKPQRRVRRSSGGLRS